MKNITMQYKETTYEDCDREFLLSQGIPVEAINSAEFQQHRNNKLALINQHCQNELNRLTDTYPTGEVSTFDKQEAEARAYTLDNSSNTPLLDALAVARELDKPELVNRIIAKADKYAAQSGAIIGKRQKLEDQLNALTLEQNSLEDIELINW